MLGFLVKQFGPNVVRHALQLASGALVANGYATAADAQMLAGAVLTAATVLWSIAEKRGLLKAVGI